MLIIQCSTYRHPSASQVQSLGRSDNSTRTGGGILSGVRGGTGCWVVACIRLRMRTEDHCPK